MQDKTGVKPPFSIPVPDPNVIKDATPDVLEGIGGVIYGIKHPRQMLDAAIPTPDNATEAWAAIIKGLSALRDVYLAAAEAASVDFNGEQQHDGQGDRSRSDPVRGRSGHDPDLQQDPVHDVLGPSPEPRLPDGDSTGDEREGDGGHDPYGRDS